MALEIQGKVTQICKEVTGTGQNGPWRILPFVIETFGQYPKPVCFESGKNLIPVIENLQIGETITVSFNPESREYNERWYSKNRAWKIDKEAQPTQPDPIPEEPAAGDDDLPF